VIRPAALLILLSSCAATPEDSTAAAYTVSLTILDASAAILLRNAPALKKLLSETFTLNRQPWAVEPLLEGIRRTLHKVQVTEASFVDREGRPVSLTLTFVEPESELIKLFRRLPPHEAVIPDIRALRRIGIHENRVRGRARCLLLTGETVDVDYTLQLQVAADSIRIQSVEFSRR
jgi:hypothetical protein